MGIDSVAYFELSGAIFVAWPLAARPEPPPRPGLPSELYRLGDYKGERTTMTTPSKPGWYPDPGGGPKKRYWDGTEWRTDQPSPKLERRRAWWAAELAKAREEAEANPENDESRH